MRGRSKDQIISDALLVDCGLKGCAAQPGNPCVNSVDGVGPRDLPHWNRVVRGRSANGLTASFDLPGGESTSAVLRRCQADLESVTRERFEAGERAIQLAAELASARTELDAVRTARDNLDAALAHTRRQLGDAVQELMDSGIPGTTHTTEELEAS